MAEDHELLKRAFAYAASQLDATQDPLRLPGPLRTFLLVFTAQGVIDNGGLQYFFESDFASQPPYSYFVDAYREVGADEAASALAAAIALFPFAEPHTQQERREAILAQYLDGGSHRADSPFEPYTDLLCGNKAVFPLLTDYVRKHRSAFKLD